MILASREDIAEQLWLRDETQLAEAILDADESTHRRVMEVAAKPLTGYFMHSEVDELLVAAAVRVLSHSRRRPRRWRPNPDRTLVDFWQHVGHDRDRRSPDRVDDITRLLDGL
ncbi:hypothetical protein SAMN05660199_00078 [Klenkia soli]|uniref:Uncharacterized protein n=1 Tax=Klenkia soli TaxID=1052260 RepID=A0A1H0BPP6_9ACTN|nr:hypothetical protein [Klenkia soli]SDN47525.1 hypothetical protein SAMN05660199_00078 [Klenkia soli]